jgi:RNA polymerase sigma-70 factor (ECF subfamily)
MALHLVNSIPIAEQPGTRADALDDLYEAHAHEVKRWARRLAGPRADLEDLMHDVFVIALRRRFTFRGEASVKTWLFRITHQVVRSRMRLDFFRGLLFLRRKDELVDAALTPSTPYQEVERREQHARLYQALDRLSDSYRTTLILYEIDGRSCEEVAELTGVSVGTVWVRLHRGRAKLLEILAKEDAT